jgi:hypothetical protein
MNRAVGDLDPWRLGFHDLIHRASEVRPGHEMSSAIEERDHANSVSLPQLGQARHSALIA